MAQQIALRVWCDRARNGNSIKGFRPSAVSRRVPFTSSYAATARVRSRIQKWEFVSGEATMALDIEEILDAVRTIMGVPHREVARTPKARSITSERARSRA